MLGDNKWSCPKCERYREAYKTLQLATAPEVLMLHLKRFSSVGRTGIKLDMMVHFPLTGLDLTRLVDEKVIAVIRLASLCVQLAAYELRSYCSQ